jgi:hypothetical protein
MGRRSDRWMGENSYTEIHRGDTETHEDFVMGSFFPPL